MLLAQGVELINKQNITNVLNFSVKSGVSLHVVNCRTHFINSPQHVINVLIESMEIYDFFGYKPEEVLISHCLGKKGVVVHIVVLILDRAMMPMVYELQQFFSMVHHRIQYSRTGKRFYTYMGVQDDERPHL